MPVARVHIFAVIMYDSLWPQRLVCPLHPRVVCQLKVSKLIRMTCMHDMPNALWNMDILKVKCMMFDTYSFSSC